MTMKLIRLELARDEEFPQGSREHGYDITAPVNDEGQLDPEGWKQHKDRCRVRRFWGDEEEDIGHLVRKPGGSWAFHYDIHGDPDDDEGGYRFNLHRFVPGEYVSIRDHDSDEMRTFKVVSARSID